MKLKLQKYDYIFIIVMLVFSMLHILCMFTPLPYNDEALYPTVALRFINGDNMIQHEWHLSQFSSVFSYLPILLWVKIKGSTEGLVLFLRVCYFLVHTFVASGIYGTFRKYKLWAAAAAMLFYTQVSYRMFTISYMSMNTVFLTLLILTLWSVYEKKCTVHYIFAGLCFAGCAVCNPLYCLVYAIYAVVCAVVFIIGKKRNSGNERSENRKNSFFETIDVFFGKKAFVFFTLGISILALICIIYFFVAGGSFSILINDLGNLFSASEYSIFNSFFSKVKDSVLLFNDVSLNVPFLLPLLYLALLFDKKRRNHRAVYLSLSLILVILYTVGTGKQFLSGDVNAYVTSLPFLIFSTVAYILTQKKNKPLFFCMWCPALIGACIQFFASNTLLTSFFAVFTVAHIPGVLFVKDLFSEILSERNKKSAVSHKRNPEPEKSQKKYFVALFAAVFCVQLSFNCFTYAYERIPDKNEYMRVDYGPLSQLYLNSDYYRSYTGSLNDLDVIMKASEEDEPVLITSRMGWMHLYADRPMAAYNSTLVSIDEELLNLYYNRNPEKIPAYIYVGFADIFYVGSRDDAYKKVRELKRLFRISDERELAAGFMLEVEGLR